MRLTVRYNIVEAKIWTIRKGTHLCVPLTKLLAYLHGLPGKANNGVCLLSTRCKGSILWNNFALNILGIGNLSLANKKLAGWPKAMFDLTAGQPFVVNSDNS